MSNLRESAQLGKRQMATSDFKIFANGQSLVGEEALNIAPLDDEQLVTETKTGFYSGLASSKKFNRVLRQGTAGTASLGALIADVLGENVTDNGKPFDAQIRKMIKQVIELDTDYVKTVNGMSPNNGDITLQPVPIGTVLPLLRKTVPSGYLLLNGATILKTNYPELFEVMGIEESSWVLPDSNARFLEGTTTLSEVGNLIAAGLPNITGEWLAGYGSQLTNPEASGAFSAKTRGLNADYNAYGWVDTGGFDFDASRSSALYGSCATVQPSSLNVLFCVRAF